MKKFKKVYIEITNVCNLDCKFCPKTKREARFMSLDEVRLVIAKFKNSAKKFYLHVMGEPCLHPDINEIVKEFKKENLNINIVTNGTIIEKLNTKNSPNSVCISLHSFSNNDTTLSLKEYIDKAINYYNNIKNNDTFTEFRLWNITKKTINNEENQFLLSYLENEIKTDINLKEYVENYVLEDNSNSSKRRFNKEIKNKLYISMAKEFSWPYIDNENDKEERGFCYGLRNQIAILSDGTVVPCCLDSEGEINLGNIFCQELIDILNSKRAKEMFDGFTAKRITENLCKNCGYRKMYFKKN